VQGGLLLFDRTHGRLLAFNDTAREVWDWIEAGRSPADLAPAFSQAWSISESRALADIDSIVGQWLAHGLLAADGAAPAPQPDQVFPEPGSREHPRPTGRGEEWTCTIRGTAIAFSVDSAVGPVRAMLRHLDTPGAAPTALIEVATTASGAFVVLRDGIERIRTVDAGQLVGGLWQTIIEAIHRDLRWLAVMHGAAVARNGAGIALSAPSGSGKSTLAAGLVGHGFDYLADDTVGLMAPNGSIVPWPLPLSIKPGSVDVLAPLYPGIAAAPRYRTKGVKARLLVPPAAAWDRAPVETRHLVFPSFVRGAAPELVTLSTFEALERLLADRVWLGNPMTESAVVAFLGWLESRPSHAVRYGALDDAVRLVEELVA
jgi:hypothetical protein